MAQYISKIVGVQKETNGVERNVTKQFLCDKDGHILHDKSREDDPEGVNRRIEVEAFKSAIREGKKLYQLDENGKIKVRDGKPQYDGLFWEEFPGTIDQAKAELEDELKAKAEIEKEYKEKLKKIQTKK